MGNAFNDKVGKFRLILTAQEKNDTKFQFEGINSEHKDVRIARMGHLCFADEETGELIIFGGSQAGNQYKTKGLRDLANDIVVYDFNRNQVTDVANYSQALVHGRMYSCGFKIDSRIFVIGGMNSAGGLLDNFDEMDWKGRTHLAALVERGKQHLKKVISADITAVFYQDKIRSENNTGLPSFNLQKLEGEVDWGNTVNLIKHEGFYMFGGRQENNQASNDLLIFKVSEVCDQHKERAKFKIIKPKTVGKPPPPRYMHTIDFFPGSNFVVVYGGRNDALNK